MAFSDMDVSSYLPYHEPSIIAILIQTSFLLVLNVLNSLFDNLIYCGLLAQVFVGVAWGTPGGKLLDRESENVVVQLGYLGLLLLVYEGGLSTNFTTLKSNLFLSILVALTGIIFPIALSFTLGPILGASPLQCFAAGAALCATSLGTTFTILRTSGLAKTRLGVVLASAAMMDDVVGLVMVQVISNLGTSSSGGFSWETIVRPLGVSLAFAVVVPLGCWGVVKPLTRALQGGSFSRVLKMDYTPFIIHTSILLGLITAATFAGTSNLFAAYLAGAAVSWWDSEINSVGVNTAVQSSESHSSSDARTTSEVRSAEYEKATSGNEVFEKFYATALHRILKPFFFASIGFAIPITEMFTGNVLWRGIVYTIMMLFAKLVTGLWLVRLNISMPRIRIPNALRSVINMGSACVPWSMGSKKQPEPRVARTTQPNSPAPKDTLASPNTTLENDRQLSTLATSSTEPETLSAPSPQSQIKKPLSLYPASILGTAMMARGEIGFLISSLAATTGIFDQETYLVVTWAILLCTIIGPLSVGTLVRRVKRLDGAGEKRVDGPLGIWGV